MQNNELFDIKECINEISEILEDKVIMKNINIDVNYNSFFGKYIVKTDMKRL